MSQNITAPVGQKLTTFIEYGDKDTRSPVWSHFYRSTCKQLAECKTETCKRIIKCSGGSTHSLHKHLLSVHQIDLSELKQKTVQPTTAQQQEQASCSKRRKITDYFPAKDSVDAIISRMVAKDGFAFSKFITSKDLNQLLTSKTKCQIPKSAETIKQRVMKFANSVRDLTKRQIAGFKTQGKKFSVTFDEWSSMKNRRYINLNLHHVDSKFWNLGLLRMKGSLNAEARLELINARLLDHELILKTDIICITTDGDSVMTKIGKISPTSQQLCFAHALQLAVVDVLYVKVMSKKLGTRVDDLTHQLNTCEASGSDAEESQSNSDEFPDKGDDTGLDGAGDLFNKLSEDENSETGLKMESIRLLIAKVRKTVQKFRNSPVNNDKLQRYVIIEHKHELNLLMDSKSRWSSMLVMLERFVLLKNSVLKALIDLGSETSFSEQEFGTLTDIVNSLQPIKAAVVALCRRDANLITADAILKFLMTSLLEQRSELSEQLYTALKSRILQRRGELSGVLQYLHSGKTSKDEIFSTPTSSQIANFIRDLVTRVTEERDEIQETEPELEITRETPNTGGKMEAAINLAIENALSSAHVEHVQKPRNVLSTVKKEMGLFEAGGKRGFHLENAYEWLKVIPPTSIESERAFSAAGGFCTKFRSRLADATIDELCFLRSHFLNTE